jgi:macrophage erythroblast attacher
MAALKTPACADTWAHHKTHPTTRLQNWIGDERKGRGDHKVATRYVCPICSPELLELSDTVPVAKVARSHLVDALDPEELLEGENIPVVLPSGRLYGLVSLRAYCKRHDIPEGKIMDPSTGEIFDATTVRKAFVL